MKNAKPYRNQLAEVERRDRQNEALDRALAMTVGSALKRARQQQGLKLKHVAQRTGVSISKLHEIENGLGKLVSAETFDRLDEAIKQEAELSAKQPTPRTDQHQSDMENEDFDVELAKTSTRARDLERELAEANEALAQATADLQTLAVAAALTVDAYDPRYFRAGAWCKDALGACKTIDSAPSKPEPDTFEAHGHTWTRHVPGDPCPVPEHHKVHIITSKGGTSGTAANEAGEFAWHITEKANYGWGEIIGWRYAEKPLPPKMKVGEWVKNSPACIHCGGSGYEVVDHEHYPCRAGCPHLVVLPTAAECGQYADKNITPAPSSTPADTPEPLQNQGFEVVSPAGIEPATT